MIRALMLFAGTVLSGQILLHYGTIAKTTAAAVLTTRGLVSYYGYQTSGTDWPDSVSSFTGTFVGSPAFSSAGLTLDASGEYITVTHDAAQNLGAAGTLEIVARPSASYPSASGTTIWRGMVAKDSGGTNATIAYSLDWYGTNAARTLRLKVSSGAIAADKLVSDYDFAGGYKYIVASWDGSTKQIFSNAVEQGTGLSSTVAAQSLSTALEIGRVFDTNTNVWSGDIAVVRISNVKLTPSEISGNYAALKGILGASILP